MLFALKKWQLTSYISKTVSASYFDVNNHRLSVVLSREGVPVNKRSYYYELTALKNTKTGDSTVWCYCSELCQSICPFKCSAVITLLDIISRIKKDVRFLKQIFKNVIIVWSNVVPKKMWCHSMKPPHVMNICAKKVNGLFSSLLTFIGGCFSSARISRFISFQWSPSIREWCKYLQLQFT